jgi:hypothetical protein
LWIFRVEPLTVTFSLLPDLGGRFATNNGAEPGLTDVLPRVVNDGGGGSRTRFPRQK